MNTQELIVQARIEAELIEKWVAAGWLIPREQDSSRDYSDLDLARACLIRDLQDLGVNDEAVPVVLDLIDQVHGLRRTMRELLASLDGQHRDPRRPFM